MISRFSVLGWCTIRVTIARAGIRMMMGSARDGLVGAGQGGQGGWVIGGVVVSCCRRNCSIVTGYDSY